MNRMAECEKTNCVSHTTETLYGMKFHPNEKDTTLFFDPVTAAYVASVRLSNKNLDPVVAGDTVRVHKDSTYKVIFVSKT